jgi:hypothetical protein
MLFKRPVLDRIAAGDVTLAFRRWRRPTVRAGGTLTTPAGVLAIESVETVAADRITAAEARQAGFCSRDDLLAGLADAEGDLYRIAFRRQGADPRGALREQDDLVPEEWAALRRRLERLDRSSRHGAWTWTVLRLIADESGTRAADLAARCDRETLTFKTDVRKLKALGLTESLKVGYRLSPRGRALLDQGRTDSPAAPAQADLCSSANIRSNCAIVSSCSGARVRKIVAAKAIGAVPGAVITCPSPTLGRSWYCAWPR